MPAPTPSRSPKVQRWMDLLTALLRRHTPATFETLKKEVPAYYDPSKDVASVMRTFERDKDELRAIGVAIDTVPDEDGNLTSYILKSRHFYLPYLVVDGKSRHSPTVQRPSGIGYQSLQPIPFTPDQLAMIIRAARRVQQMGHPGLAADANSAMRKLAHDVTIGADQTSELSLPTPSQAAAATLELLDDAVRRRKEVTFEYHSIGRDVTSVRRVHPYGLLFLSSVWYLVAHDPEADTIRNFRVSRIRNSQVNKTKEQSADYALPADFDLWARAESRRAWELGEEDAITVTVRFSGADAYSVAGAELGEEADDGARVFPVRRPEPFVRWLLSFGGSAVPLSPPDIVDAWRELAAQTLATYGGAA